MTYDPVNHFRLCLLSFDLCATSCVSKEVNPSGIFLTVNYNFLVL